ncbi:MAG: hypothetical protein ACRDK0_02940, partial [Solirubrobacteraceae bacterium]
DLHVRLAATGIAAVIALAVLLPGALQPGGDSPGPDRLAFSSATVTYRPSSCDRPRGATFVAARPCATPGATSVTPDLLERRYAVN